MGFWAPDPPPTPDYQSLALQQGQMDKETARMMWFLNHPDEYTPDGSNTWTPDPNNPDKFIRNENLSPEAAARKKQQDDLMAGLLQGANDYAMPALMKALQTNFAPPREAQLGWENDYAPDQRLQTESGMWEAPYIQEGLDFSGAPKMPVADEAMRKRMEEALYSKGARFMDPRWERDQKALQTDLSNQGIYTGSAAHADAMREFNDAKTQAYGNLQDTSIAGGGDELARQYGLDMSSRQQGVGEITQQGQFANSARGQLISELLQDMQQRNAGIMGQANLATAQQGASNTGTQAWIAQKGQSSTLPINIMTALMSGSQINTPQFQPFAANAQWDSPQVYQAGKDQFAGDMAGANFKQAGMGQWLNLGGKLATGWMGMP
jgi:hypothetical protein